jgi:hypothetical protein
MTKETTPRGKKLGPVSTGWREGALTRANELEAQCGWVLANEPVKNSEALAIALRHHLDAARLAATARPRRILWIFRCGSLIECALSNLYAAEANLLHIASADYLLGLIPSLLTHVQSHLAHTDPRRQEFERIAQRLGVKDPDHALTTDAVKPEEIVREQRGRIVSITRAASSAAVREQVRVRSFRNIIVVTTLAMTALMIGVALTGFLNHTLISLCFVPEEAGRAVVVCPTGQSSEFPARQENQITTTDVDDKVRDTATPYDLFVVELVGLSAAAIATAAAIRGIRGSSERYGLPVALAALKLPTGAMTAFLGLLLMRGQFVPGLSALDTPAQILAWALVFGYAQQVFTRLVDRQGQSVLDSVRDADKTARVTAQR